jgi:hypothetical protein
MLSTPLLSCFFSCSGMKNSTRDTQRGAQMWPSFIATRMLFNDQTPFCVSCPNCHCQSAATEAADNSKSKDNSHKASSATLLIVGEEVRRLVLIHLSRTVQYDFYCSRAALPTVISASNIWWTENLLAFTTMVSLENLLARSMLPCLRLNASTDGRIHSEKIEGGSEVMHVVLFDSGLEYFPAETVQCMCSTVGRSSCRVLCLVASTLEKMLLPIDSMGAVAAGMLVTLLLDKDLYAFVSSLGIPDLHLGISGDGLSSVPDGCGVFCGTFHAGTDFVRYQCHLRLPPPFGTGCNGSAFICFQRRPPCVHCYSSPSLPRLLLEAADIITACERAGEGITRKESCSQQVRHGGKGFYW